MREVPAESFEWVHDEAVVMYSLTFVEGMSAAEVLAAVDAEPVHGPRTWRTVKAGVSSQETGVLVAPARGWTVLIELESLLGEQASVLSGLSYGGRRVLNLLRTGSGMQLVQYWVNGALLCQFEPGAEDVRSGAMPDVLLEHMRAVGMRIGPDDDVPAVLEAPLLLAERLTGVTADRALVLDAAWPAGLVV